MNLDEPKEKKMSKKARKQASRLTVAELKQLVRRPDVVEVEDVTAADPRLLVYLKSYRNTVPVPRHWCSKRHYLQGRRGTEKTPFKLPGIVFLEWQKCRLYCKYWDCRDSCVDRRARARPESADDCSRANASEAASHGHQLRCLVCSC